MYVKRKIKLKKTGLTAFVRQIQTEFFEDDEEISNLKLSARFIARIIHDCGRRTSKRTDRAFLTEEQKKIEFTRLRRKIEQSTSECSKKQLKITSFFKQLYS